MKDLYVAVCGASNATQQEEAWAQQIGGLLAEAGAIVVTGGLGGVMAAAAKGAAAGGGTSVGILPGPDRRDANPFNTVAIATGMGETRNALIVQAADVFIAVGGEFGTLSEIALALRIGKPVVGLGTWDLARPGLDVPIEVATSPEHAVDLAIRRR